MFYTLYRVKESLIRSPCFLRSAQRGRAAPGHDAVGVRGRRGPGRERAGPRWERARQYGGDTLTAALGFGLCNFGCTKLSQVNLKIRCTSIFKNV